MRCHFNEEEETINDKGRDHSQKTGKNPAAAHGS